MKKFAKSWIYISLGILLLGGVIFLFTSNYHTSLRRSIPFISPVQESLSNSRFKTDTESTLYPNYTNEFFDTDLSIFNQEVGDEPNTVIGTVHTNVVNHNYDSGTEISGTQTIPSKTSESTTKSISQSIGKTSNTNVTTTSLGSMGQVDLDYVRNPFQNPLSNGELTESSLEVKEITSANFEPTIPTLEVTYQDLYQEKIIQPETNPESVTIPIPLEYPPFILQGIVTQRDRHKVILFANGQSRIASLGDKVYQNWRIELVQKDFIQVKNHHGQGFILTLEGVTVDDEG